MRRVTPLGILSLEIAASLVRSLGMPIAQALDTAARLISANGTAAAIPGAQSIRISADVEAVRVNLNARLERALEMSPTPRRGRPGRK